MAAVDENDILQAVEIALGDRLEHTIGAKRATEAINNGVVLLKRILAELPPETMVHELLEALEQ